MLECVLRRATALAPTRRVLAMTPDESAHAFPDAAASWTHVSQGPGDLGQRIVRVLSAESASAIMPTVILGSDSPDLPDTAIHNALVAVRSSAGACAVPSRDGGYCMIAVRDNPDALFRNIDWGSEQVMQQTRAAATAASVPLVELAAWQDVDTGDDVRALLDRTRCSRDPHLRHLHEQLVSFAPNTTHGADHVVDVDATANPDRGR